MRAVPVQSNNQCAAVAPRPSTTHPLVWAEQHNLCQAYLPDLTSLTHPFTILPINPSNFPKIPRWKVSEDGVVKHIQHRHIT